MNDTRRAAGRCDQYVVPCEPGKDSGCGNWVVDGKYVKETLSYRACRDTIDRERLDCDQYPLIRSSNHSESKYSWCYPRRTGINDHFLSKPGGIPVLQHPEPLLLALFTTWAIEIPVLIVLIRFVFREKILPLVKIIGLGAFGAALTLPYLWVILPPYVDAAYYVIIGETLVFFVEALILNRLLGISGKMALVCSFLMNAASFILGLYLL